ncbi:MAG: acyltransferase [Lachnospiraceae bacterium]|nr:acyltransferase [Lachnospiraceae bacterium]
MKDRNNNIGTIHLLAAFCVMYGHQFALVQQPMTASIGCAAHILGVKIIMLISGYLITKSLWSMKQSKARNSFVYAVKRLGRILPEYLFVLLVSALVFGPILSTLPVGEYFKHPLTYSYITDNAIFKPVYSLPGVFTANPYSPAVNGSLWTIPVELFMYVGIWIIYLIPHDKLKKVLYVLAALVASILMFTRIEYYPLATLVFHNVDWLQALNIIPYFLVGGCFYLLDLKKYLKVQWAVVVAVVFSLIKYKNQFVIEWFELMAIAYIVMTLCLADKQELKLPILKGEYSYGVYLWGFVVQQCVVDVLCVRMGFEMKAGILFIISGVIAYVLAMISYNFVYKPIWKLLNKYVLRSDKAYE